MIRDDARMTALCIVRGAKSQEFPSYPITRKIEGGHRAGQGAVPAGPL